MNLIIRDSLDRTVATLDKVISCSVDEKLSGEKTLSFETVLDGDLENISDSADYVVWYNSDCYDVTKVVKSLKSGLYMIAFTCEHVSYRLSDTTLQYFAFNGTPAQFLDRILTNTGFTRGTVESSATVTFDFSSAMTIRAAILKYASDNELECLFSEFGVSLLTHRGQSTAYEIIEKNVVSISKTNDKLEDTNSYALTVRESTSVQIGDEVKLKFTKLGIDTTVRVIGIKRTPFTSKNITLEVDTYSDTIEDQTAEIISNAVNKGQKYYGVKISEANGLEVTRDDSNARVVMNADEFRMQAKEDGEMVDKLYFDPESGTYKFAGTVSIVGGSINIGNHFVVDANGNCYLSGSSTIYGGKYYAGTPGSQDGYSQMTENGFVVYNGQQNIKLRFGYTTDGEDYPYVQLGSGSGLQTDYGLVKKFSDGLWIGNAEPEDESGTFTAKTGYNGIFFRFTDNTAYVVKNTEMKNIYTGLAIAKFG